jgi:hypothetical protein
MAEAKINLSVSVQEFDLLRDELWSHANTLKGKLKQDTKASAERQKLRERIVRIDSFLERLK